MGLSIGTNSTQLTLLANHAQANRFTNRSSERLATSLRINSASDDPAGLIGAEQLRGDLVEINAQFRVIDSQRQQINIQQSGRRTATGVLQEIGGLLVEAADDNISSAQREALQLQVDSSLDALDRLGATTGFALPATLDALRSGGSANLIDGDPTAGAALVKEQLSNINLASAAAGAYQKYTLDVDQRLAEDRAVATAAALSSLADADYVQESSNLITGQILTEASIRTIALTQQINADSIRLLFEVL